MNVRKLDGKLSSWLVMIALIVVVVPPRAGHSQSRVRQITIRSHWGGLGPRADATIVITRTQGGYEQSGQSVASPLVNALVAALRTPLIPKPDPLQLGITPSWLSLIHISLNEICGILYETRTGGHRWRVR